ncbi:MAG: hypothetical protein AAF668_13110, partial [Pseudomonadota bacterium]
MNAGKSLAKVNQVTDDTALGADATAALLRGRTSVKNFLMTSDPEEIEAYREAGKQFQAAKAEAKAHFTDPHRLALVAQIEADFKKYDNAVSEVAGVVLRSDKLKKQTLDVVGPQTTDAMKKRFYTVSDAGQSELAYRLTPPLLDILEGRLYFMKFVRTMDDADYQRATYEFEASAKKLQAVIDDFPGVPNTDSLATLREQVIAYDAAVREVHSLLVQRDQIVANQIDVLGPQMVKTQHDIQDSLIETSHAVAKAADESIVLAEILISVVSGVAILLGLIACFFITRMIVKPIRGYLVQVAKVGEGDLSARLTTEQADEWADLSTPDRRSSRWQ